MKFASMALSAAGALALVALATAPAAALGLKDCSDKYSAAKAAGKVGTKTFADFQKSDCGEGAAPAAAATTPPAAAAKPTAAAPAATPAPATAKAEKKSKKAAKAEAAAAAKAVPTGPVTGPVFPAAIAEAYKTKKPSKARMATCLDQYRTNKATNANGGLRWIQKGGGYYSQCNKKLKTV